MDHNHEIRGNSVKPEHACSSVPSGTRQAAAWYAMMTSDHRFISLDNPFKIYPHTCILNIQIHILSKHSERVA